MKKLALFLLSAVASGAMINSAAAQAPIEAPVTTATSIHGAPGNTPGSGGNSANPNGNGVNGGNGIHNIAGGAPGQNGEVNPGEKGGPSNDMHGGLDATTGRFD